MTTPGKEGVEALGHAPSESAAVRSVGGSRVGGASSIARSHPGLGSRRISPACAPDATERILLHAGTCRRHGASFAAVVAGRLLFHGSSVPISTVADGAHCSPSSWTAARQAARRSRYQLSEDRRRQSTCRSRSPADCEGSAGTSSRGTTNPVVRASSGSRRSSRSPPC